MSTIGSLLAGLAVAVGGVMIGRKLEQAKWQLGGQHKSPDLNNNKTSSKVIDAEQDPETGVYKSNTGK